MSVAYEIPDELLARCAGQASICKTVVAKFVEQMNGDLPQLVQAIESSDHEQVARLAHRIKGASANVAVEDLRSIAARLETAATDASAQYDLSSSELCDELTDAWHRFQELTAEFLNV